MDKRETAVDAFIQSEMEKQQIPGLALGVMVRGAPVLLKGYGWANLEHRVAVTPDTPFEIASVTKLFTATAVMMLVNEGKLDLVDPIGRYLPDLPPAWRAITLRHILTHQSGLKGYTEVDRYWDTTRLDISRTEIVDLVRSEPLMFPSGQRHAYDNTGFYLLGMVLERICGKSYGDVLKELVFSPLGMNHSRANDPYAVIPDRAAGYSLQDGVVHNKAYYSTSGTYSAGVLLSTVADMARWDAALCTNSLLPRKAREQMWAPHPSEEKNEREFSFSMGLGWFLVDHKNTFFVGHNGSIVGFASSYLRFLQKEVSVVLFCNQDAVTEPHQLAIFAAEQFIPLD